MVELAYRILNYRWIERKKPAPVWTVKKACYLQDEYSNNINESVHEGLHRSCPKGYVTSTLDWKTRNRLNVVVHTLGHVALVRIHPHSSLMLFVRHVFTVHMESQMQISVSCFDTSWNNIMEE